MLTASDIRYNTKLIKLCIGMMFLLIGFLFYYFIRASNPPFFIHIFHPSKIHFSYMPHFFYNNSPSFLHVVAFSFITAGIWSGDKSTNVLVNFFSCFSWFLIDLIFECMQSLTVISKHLILKNHIGLGIYDVKDIWACALGAFLSFFILTILDFNSTRRRV